MRHLLSGNIVAALLVTTAVEVVALTNLDATTRHHYAAPTPVISVALPTGMKSFPVELPQ
jgi:hypothetical protein